MLVIDENSVYEIDEVCVKKRGISKQCGIDEKLIEKIEGTNRQKEMFDIINSTKQSKI